MLVSASDYADLGNALNQACTNLIGVADRRRYADHRRRLRRRCQGGDWRPRWPSQLRQLADRDRADVRQRLRRSTSSSTTSRTPAAATGPPRSRSAGANSWYYPQNPNLFLGFDATYATSGDTNMLGGDRSTPSDSYVRMANSDRRPGERLHALQPRLRLRGRPARTHYDGGVVEYSTSGSGGPWIDAGSLFDSGSGYNGNARDRVRQPDHAGRPGGLRRRVERIRRQPPQPLQPRRPERDVPIPGLQDTGGNDFGWYIDDVQHLPVLHRAGVLDRRRVEERGQLRTVRTPT